MALSTGTKLGPYEIVCPLGAGGMGEVYRAKDTRLHREVAFKILSGDGIDNLERQRRFTQEARAASALNHPNILSVYDVGSENGTPFIVSELIEGESLRKLIQKGPVPLKKFLDVAVQISDGLAAAHQSGIVHRDLKPENIMITREGRVKILDFGLAKPTSKKLGDRDDETISKPITESGIIVGTVKYMSPEQASGQVVDFRSDQFSLGLILYEMGTGKQAFERNTPVQTLSAIVSEEPPPISTLNPKVPAPIRWLIERCLQKDPQNRYASTLDLHHELRNLRDHITETASSDAITLTPSKRSAAKWMIALIAIVGALLLLLSQFSQNKNLTDLSSLRYTSLVVTEALEAFPYWSPDGKSIAYSADVNGFMQIFTRSLNSSTPVQITKDATHHWAPFWSPDGSRLFYFDNTNGDLRAVSAAGGSSDLVLRKGITGAGISPDGKTLAFLRFESDDSISLWIASSSGGAQKKILDSTILKGLDGFVRFSRDGSKIGIWNWATNSKSEFWVVPFPEGKPQKFLSAISHIYWRRQFDWHPDGKHIYFQGFMPGEKGMHLLLGDLVHNKIRPITVTYGSEHHPSLSPDGTKIAFTQTENHRDLVEIPLDGSPMRNLLSTASSEYSPSWSPSGSQIVYGTDQNTRSEIWLKNLKDGSTRPLVSAGDIPSTPSWEFSEPAFSPDGQRVAYQGRQPAGQSAIWVSNIVAGQPVALTHASESQDFPTWSPDGEWIAYVTRVSGIRVLAKTKTAGDRHQIVIYKNIEYQRPQWSPSGEWISVGTPEGLMLISPDGKTTRIVSDNYWYVQGWSNDASQILGIRGMLEDDNGNRLLLSAIDIKSGKETILSDMGRIPPIGGIAHGLYLDGFTLSHDGKSLATSILRAKADILILEGFEKQIGFWTWLKRK